jgi:hypothetical protein
MQFSRSNKLSPCLGCPHVSGQPCIHPRASLHVLENRKFSYPCLELKYSSLVIQPMEVTKPPGLSHLLHRPHEMEVYIRLKVRDAHGFFMYSLLHYTCSTCFGCYWHPSSAAQTADYSRRYTWLLWCVGSWVVHWRRLWVGHLTML